MWRRRSYGGKTRHFYWINIDFRVSNLNKEGTIELRCASEVKKRTERGEEAAEECYLSTGELKPLGDPELPCSMLLDTAILYK